MQGLRHVVVICGQSQRLHQKAAEVYSSFDDVRLVRLADHTVSSLFSISTTNRKTHLEDSIESVLCDPLHHKIVFVDVNTEDEISDITSAFPNAVVVELLDVDQKDHLDMMLPLPLRAHSVMCINNIVTESILKSLLLTHNPQRQ